MQSTEEIVPPLRYVVVWSHDLELCSGARVREGLGEEWVFMWL